MSLGSQFTYLRYIINALNLKFHESARVIFMVKTGRISLPRLSLKFLRESFWTFTARTPKMALRDGCVAICAGEIGSLLHAELNWRAARNGCNGLLADLICAPLHREPGRVSAGES